MDPALAAATVRRGGFFTTEDVRDAGFDLRRLRRALTSGSVTRLRRSCFASTENLAQLDADARHRLDVRIAMHLLEVPAVPSHRSAAVLLGLPLLARPQRVYLTSVTACTRRDKALHVRRAPLPECDVQEIAAERLHATSAARTVLDLAREVPLEEGVVVADAALQRKLVTPESLQVQADSHTGWPGMVRARQVLSKADGRSESPGETRLRLLLQSLGYEVEPQAWLQGATGEWYRVDLLIKGTPVIVEFDGMVKYKGKDAEAVLLAEKARADDLGNAGHPIVRVVWKELRMPAHVDRVVRDALARSVRLSSGKERHAQEMT